MDQEVNENRNCDRNSQSLVNQLRHETSLTINDIREMKKSVDFLIQDFKKYHLQSNKTRMSIDQFSEGLLDLEFTFKQVG